MTATNLRFPSIEWCAAFKDAINANLAYKVAGRDWTHGPVAMVVSAEPAIGIAEDMGVVIDGTRARAASASSLRAQRPRRPPS
jgi:hypothetical protein